MKKILYIFPLVLTLALSATIAFVAADDYLITGEDVLTFTGNLGKQYADKMVSFVILKNGNTINDFLIAETQQEKLNMLECYKQTTSDNNGDYSVEFSLNGKSNLYNAYTGIEKTDSYKETRLYYVKDSENEAAREKIKQAASASKIEELINSEKFSLNLDYKLIEKTDISKLSEFLFKNNISTDNVLASSAATSDKINKTAAIVAFSDRNISIFSDYYDCFGIDEELSKYYNFSFMNSSAKQMAENLFSRKYENYAEFDHDLLISTVKSVIYYADGFGYIKEILMHYADELDIVKTKITDKVCNKLIGTMVVDIKTAVNKAYEDSTAVTPETVTSGRSTGVKNDVKASDITVPAPIYEQATPYEKKSGGFEDLADVEWARNAITELADRGVIKGKEDGFFYPKEKILREEFIKMIMEAFEFAELSGEVEFTDVSYNDWFSSYVKNAYLAGIVKGVSDSEFGSGRYISRQDMVVIVDNALQKKGVKSQTNQQAVEFADKDIIDGYAINAINRLSSAKIILGDNGYFHPLDSSTRAEAAQLIYRILPYINEGV